MRFHVFGKKTLEVVRQDNHWLVFYCGSGIKRKADDIQIPPALPEAELKGYIADLFHEWATPDHDDVIQLS